MLAIGFLITLLLLNVGIAAAAGTTPANSGATTATPSITDDITTAIQTLVTGIITPAPTPAPSGLSAAKAASPSLDAPGKAKIPAVQMPVPKINPVIEKAVNEHGVMRMHNITSAQRMEAALAAAAQGLKVKGAPSAPVKTTGTVKSAAQVNTVAAPVAAALVPQHGGTPDYFGANSNYALSQLPTVDTTTGSVVAGTGIRKFVDTLPGLTEAGANNLGQYIPLAVPDKVSYPANGVAPEADYYEIAAVEWAEQMHSDIPATTIRGYVQLETPIMNVANGSKHVALKYLDNTPILNPVTNQQVYAYENPHYLGPLIIAQKDRPVRVKFQNYLKVGGKLSIPTDIELMGSGLGPQGAAGGLYSEQRAAIHLHGGNTPWISDGTQHQWTVPAGENTAYPLGVSVAYVPDMDNGIEPVGTLTFYYTNQQSARLMFYHEHAMGMTRLGVLAGEAGAYIVQDPAEAALVAMGAIPTTQIPLVIQDRTFVPDAAQMTAQDPTWNAGGNLTSPWPHTGDFYFPHVYMPAQNQTGSPTPMGRWDYGPWAFPPYMTALNPPVANPYYDPVNAPWEPKQIPGVPTVSQVPETFLDTPLINGAAYPKLTLGPHAYRFRILNAANERFVNLQLYKAASSAAMWNPDGTLADANAGEVPMVPAVPTAGFPASWPVDGRDGGVPDPAAAGPSWIQIGSEGGFLPAPVVIKPQPVGFDPVFRSTAATLVTDRSLLIGPAERADVIVDFSGIPDGTKLILYNDAPAPFPGPDTRYDFYTGDPDQSLIGGAPTTQPGYGPNTRTLMQIEIQSSVPQVGPAFDQNALNTNLPLQYATVQDKPLVPQAAYNTAFGAAYTDQYLSLPSTSMTFIPSDQASPITMKLTPKAITEGFDPDYGRITANFGVEVLPVPGQVLAKGIGYFNNDPFTEVFNNSVKGTLIGSQADGTQIWKVTHNGVDTHILHVHMYNLQVINRVYWDGTIVPPEANELGWKESVQINPLQDLVVAMRPITPDIPWELPNSIHPINPVTAIGSATPMEFTNLDPLGNQVRVVNHAVNFGWEYVWHCHLLGHEENDMMRSQVVAVAPKFAPGNLAAEWVGPNTTPKVNLTWKDTTVSETNWTVQRAGTVAGPWVDLKVLPSTTGPQKDGMMIYQDPTVVSLQSYVYRVLATNVVGDTTVYAGSIGYPNITVNSVPSNTAVPTITQTKIEVTSPNGGESWVRGTSHPITWTYTGSPGSTVKIVLLRSGVQVATIASSTSIGSAGTGSYAWTVPSLTVPGTTYKVQVQSIQTTAVKDTSDNNFAIVTAAPPVASISVKSPNGGESWAQSTSHAITWSYTGSPGNVKILLLKGGVQVATIANSVSVGSAGSGSYTWPVSTTAIGSDYTVTVQSVTQAAVTDTSDNNFAIVAAPPTPTIKVTTPNGGEVWKRGTSQTISWSYTNDPGSNVKIVLLKSGIQIGTIASSVSVGSGGTGSYTWPISRYMLPGSDYKVSISSTSQTSVKDSSDNTFRITF